MLGERGRYPLPITMNFFRIAIFLGVITFLSLFFSNRFVPRPTLAQPSNEVLVKLDTHFDSLNSNMTLDECFEVLGLGPYRQYLALSCRMHGRNGTNYRRYLGHVPDYQLCIATNFYEKTATLELKTPANHEGRVAKIRYKREHDY